MSMAGLMFITAIGTHIRNHNPDYNRIDTMQLAMAMYNSDRKRVFNEKKSILRTVSVGV